MPDVENDGRNRTGHAVEANEQTLGAEDGVVHPAASELGDTVATSHQDADICKPQSRNEELEADGAT